MGKLYPLANAGINSMISPNGAGDGENFAVGASYVRNSAGNYTVTLNDGVNSTNGICLATPRGSAFCWCTVEHVSDTVKTVHVWNGSGPVDNDYDFVAVNGNNSGEWDAIGISIAAVVNADGTTSYARGGHGVLSVGAGLYSFVDTLDVNKSLVGFSTPVNALNRMLALNPVGDPTDLTTCIQATITADVSGSETGSPHAMLCVDPERCTGVFCQAAGSRNLSSDPRGQFTCFGGAFTAIGTGHYRLTLSENLNVGEDNCIILATPGRPNFDVDPVSGAITVLQVSDTEKDIFTFNASGVATDLPFSLIILVP